MKPSRVSLIASNTNKLAQMRAQNLLRQAQVRVTDARLQVLNVLLETHSALSHLEIQDALPQLDRVTLYRALDCLTEVGLAHKITGDDRVFRYSTGNEPQSEHATRSVQHQHAHFKCSLCAKMFCLDGEQSSSSLKEQLSDTLQTTLAKGFKNHDIELTIKGWCADCSK
ncbi:Fur family transcriptional regulator [Undibacterium sp.]|uniref:Fur family transcriptional regulator n=1 Tax=Undibacterium sp. TaxID=1914977 RepID=UPI0025EA0F71|nr:Fur family transcriptional regulator [Undibacterium sp.]